MVPYILILNSNRSQSISDIVMAVEPVVMGAARNTNSYYARQGRTMYRIHHPRPHIYHDGLVKTGEPVQYVPIDERRCKTVPPNEANCDMRDKARSFLEENTGWSEA